MQKETPCQCLSGTIYGGFFYADAVEFHQNANLKQIFQKVSKIAFMINVPNKPLEIYSSSLLLLLRAKDVFGHIC